MNITEAVEAAAKAWFNQVQAQRRDDGRKREDGQAWQWDDLSVMDRNAYRALVLLPVNAACLVIKAQVRESIAREIEQAASDRSYDSEETVTESYLGAASIARGEG